MIKKNKIVAQKRSVLITGFLVFYLTISPLSIYSSSFLEVVAYILLVFMLYKLSLVPEFRCETFKRNISLTVFLLSLAFIVPAFFHLELPFTTDLLQWIFIVCLFLINNNARTKVLKVVVNIFCFVLFLSLIEYLVGYIYGVSYVVNTMMRDDIPITQSFFNLYRYGDLTYRFTALCNEPGALGAVCGFIICFLPFERKYFYQISICLVAGILSLSLAFYIYIAFIIAFKFLSGKLSVKYIVFLCMLAIMAYFSFGEQISKAIFLRVVETEYIDNRSDENVNTYVSNILSSDKALFGYGNRTAYRIHEDSNIGNAGLKWKLYQYGICGVFFYFLALLLLYKKYRNKNVSFSFGIIYYLLYFYSVGNWAVPFFMFLIFSTLPKGDNNKL